MIVFALLLASAACCSAGLLPTERKYLPPSHTPNNQYLPPAQTQSPNKVYLPPLAPPASTFNRVYTPSAPNNQYLPPSPPPTPNKGYLPPTPPSPIYLPPTPVHGPNNAYVPPSPPATPNNVYLPPSKPNSGYLPPSSGSSFGSSGSSFGSSGSSYGTTGITGAVFHQQTVSSRPVAILKQVNDNKGDGVYTFSYETEDGTTAEEHGQLKSDGAEGSVSAQGTFSFMAPDNVRYTVTYTADENGFQAQGAHLPVPPPIPDAILKALADNAADEARGIMDDGSYKGEPQGYPHAGAPSSQGDASYYQHSSANQGYPREHHRQNGYQRDVPSRPFNF